MNTASKIVELEAIIFESNDPEILVKGTVKEGVFSYLTEYIINHSQLNKLINQISKLNENFDTNTCFKSEEIFDGNTLYSADLSTLKNKFIDLGELFNLSRLKKIRA